jgi:hypothetical protein
MRRTIQEMWYAERAPNFSVTLPLLPTSATTQGQPTVVVAPSLTLGNQLTSADCGGSSAARVKIGAWAKGYRRDNKSVQICAWGLGAGRDRNPGDPFLFV